MTPNVRFYSSEHGAREVDAMLEEAGFSVRSLLLPSELAGHEEEAVNYAIQMGTLPERQIKICTRSLQEGRSLVAVRAPFGRGVDALEIMETHDCVDSDLLRRYRFNDPAPLSAIMGLPVLSKYVPSSGLVSSNWSLTSGFGLLIRSPAPLSSTCSAWEHSRRPSRIGLRAIGFPLLSRIAAPLSGMFALPTLFRSKVPWRSSFGFPLISQEPSTTIELAGRESADARESSISAEVSQPQAPVEPTAEDR